MTPRQTETDTNLHLKSNPAKFGVFTTNNTAQYTPLLSALFARRLFNPSRHVYPSTLTIQTR